MKISQIECFLAVARERHFGRAAETLSRSQPPVSRQVRLLEEELGVQLLSRGPHSVELTAAGRAFQREAELGLAHLRQAARSARRMAAPAQPRIRIGATASVMLGIFAVLLARFRRDYPDLDFELKIADKFSQLALLQDDKLDMAVVRSLPEGGVLHVTRLIEEPIVVAMSSAHPLAAYGQVELQQLSPYGFILYRGRSQHSVADLLVQWCRQAGFEPAVVHEADDMQTAALLASMNIGIALVAASLQNMSSPGLVFRPALLQGEPVTMPLYLVCRKGEHSEALAEFIRMGLEHCNA